MEVQRRNDATMYCLSSGPTLPEWLGERARRNLTKRDESIRRRIELIQDFSMPSSCSKIVQSKDGRYFVAAGTYPPRIRCYDVHDLTMKFERYVNAHVVDLTLLAEDYGKIAMLLDDRTVSIHAPYGAHESVRIPSFGRAMAYEASSCELLLAAKGNQVYRLNLEEGRFCEPWSFEPAKASSTCIAVSPAHALAAVGCDDGIVRFWDNRSPDALLRPYLTLDVQSATAGYGYADQNNTIVGNLWEISSIAHDHSGLYMAAGTAAGLVALYDVRSSHPLHVMEHKHGTPIHTVQFHTGSATILSSDEKLLKIWRYRPSADSGNNAGGDESNNPRDGSLGSVVVNVEGTGKFAHFITAGDESDPSGNESGLIMCATEQPKMETYYIPSLGLAPNWCSFLDSITEELEERDLTREGTSSSSDLLRDGQESIYENYKFVSRDEVEKLGISNLVGTPLLRGYMHGFFLDIQLYNRIRSVANPFEYEEYRKKKLKERLEAKQASRIAPKESRASKKGSMHAINPEFAARLLEKADNSTKAGKLANQVLSDDRFGRLFCNPDYHIDEEDINFKLRNPSGVAASKEKDYGADFDSDDDSSNREDREPTGFHRVGSDSGHETEGGSDCYDSNSDDDGFQGGKVRGEMYEEMKKAKDAGKHPKAQKRRLQKEKRKKSTKTIKMYEPDDCGDGGNDALDIGLGDVSATSKAKRRNAEISMPLEQRLQQKRSGDEATPKLKIYGEGASREVSYVPKDARKKMQEAKKRRDETKNSDARGRRKRRGIGELGFKTPFKNTK